MDFIYYFIVGGIIAVVGFLLAGAFAYLLDR
jgi:hypothetical protein